MFCIILSIFNLTVDNELIKLLITSTYQHGYSQVIHVDKLLISM